MSDKSVFNTLAALNVSAHVEKKGGFSYLSWPYAVGELRKHAPDARWEVVRFNGLPFMQTDCGYFVEVAVTVDGITLSQIHPVLNHQNKPIPQPNAFDINTSIQRCLVKAIALHGLGLYIYAGEDLPGNAKDGGDPILGGGEPVDAISKEEKEKFYISVSDCLEMDDSAGMKQLWAEWDTDQKALLWGLFNSAQRAAMKKLLKGE